MAALRQTGKRPLIQKGIQKLITAENEAEKHRPIDKYLSEVRHLISLIYKL